MGHRRFAFIAAALGILLAFPALRGGLEVDDNFHRAILTGVLPTRNVLFDLFSFFPANQEARAAFLDLGFHPWWAHPELSVALFRPVTAATHYLDTWLFPHQIVLHHLQSVLWYALGILVVSRIYRRVQPLPGPSAAAPFFSVGLATLLFAVEDAHGMTAVWLANRNALVALVFGGLCILSHMRWRQTGRFAHGLLALVLLAVGLLGAEAAIGAVAYVTAYQLTLDSGKLAKRLRALVPYAALVVGWRLLYNALGYGVRGSGLYLDPGQDPLDFLGAVAARLPVLMLSQWTQAPVDVWMMMPDWLQLGLVLGGAILCVALVFLFLPVLRTNEVARFWGLGMVLASVPVCAAFPMARLLLFPGIGAFGLLVCLVQQLVWSRKALVSGSDRIRKVVCVSLLVLHLPVAMVLFPLQSLTMMSFSDTTKVMMSRTPADPAVADQTFVFVNGLDIMTFYLPLVRRLEGKPAPRQTVLLASMFDDNTIERVDDRTLLIRPTQGFLASDGDRLLRDDRRPFEVGEKILRKDFEVTVTEVEDGRARAARFVFNTSLGNPALHWFYWNNGALDRFRVPKVGEHVVVAKTLPDFWLGEETPIRLFAASWVPH